MTEGKNKQIKSFYISKGLEKQVKDYQKEHSIGFSKAIKVLVTKGMNYDNVHQCMNAYLDELRTLQNHNAIGQEIKYEVTS